MLELYSLFDFSRSHCVAICAFLVPANLLMTLLTIALVGMGRRLVGFGVAVSLAHLLAIAMLLHVFTWLAIGVIMPPTFILFSLAGVCLSINTWAIVHPESMVVLLRVMALKLGWVRKVSTQS